MVAGDADNIDFVVIRYNNDGTLDTGFDTDGVKIFGWGSGADLCYGVALDASQNIICAGYSFTGVSNDFSVAKLSTIGELDATFSSDGWATVDLSTNNTDGCRSLAIQQDGKIVLAGSSYMGSTWDVSLARFKPDGSLDADGAGFSVDGKVTTPIGSTHDNVYCMALQSNGYIVVAGRFTVPGSTTDIFLTRYEGSSGPLPVELTSFTASTANNKVSLNWQTATEVNNYGFEVERASTSPGMTWEKIGFIQGHGNSNSPKEYSFSDKPFGGNEFKYRLKQIDFDGQYEYSKEVEVSIDIPQEFSVSQNFPNPFNPSTNIKFSIPSDDNVVIKVFNVIGMEVVTLLNEHRQAGTYHIEFSAIGGASDLASGIYFYKVVSGNHSDIKKMILLR